MTRHMIMLRGTCGAALCSLLTTAAALAGDNARIELNVAAPNADTRNTPLHATIALPDSFANVPPEQIAASLQPPGVTAVAIPGQIVRAGEKTELWWIAPELEQGRPGKWVATLRIDADKRHPGFGWKASPGRHSDLVWNDHQVLRYLHAFDSSTPERLHETYKPYHHVFDASGQNLLTNGAGGLYPHHRGIFVGWNKTKAGDKEYDFWHMKEVAQRHQRILSQSAGPVLARSKTLIHWVDPDDKPVIVEQREVTVFRQPAPTVLLLDFRTELKPVAGDVFLGGDPEHAGVQYRAHNDVADGDETVKATYLFHEDGIDAHEDENLPWAAMSYGLNGRRYSVLHMNHPANPKPSKYSAYRDYGRFGAFFTKQLKSGETLSLRYRILVIEGPLPPREQLSAQHSAFVAPPNVTAVNDKP